MTDGAELMRAAAAKLNDRASRGLPTLLPAETARRLAAWLEEAAAEDPVDTYRAYAVAAALTDTPIAMAQVGPNLQQFILGDRTYTPTVSALEGWEGR